MKRITSVRFGLPSEFLNRKQWHHPACFAAGACMLISILCVFFLPQRVLHAEASVRASAGTETSLLQPIPVSWIDAISLSAMTPTEQQMALSGLSLNLAGNGVYADESTARAVWHASYNAALDNTSSEKAGLQKDAEGKVRVTLYQYTEDRQSISDAVIRKFGITRSEDPFTAIAGTSARVGQLMQYDRNYKDVNMLTSLQDGKGVCQQYSIIAYILLNAQGIPTRRVRGTLTTHRNNGTTQTGFHAWNQSFVNGSWITVDFTPYSNGTPNAGIVSAAHVTDYQTDGMP